MSRYENVLPARPKVVDPSAGDIVVDQELALIRPALSVSSRFAVPSLPRLQVPPSMGKTIKSIVLFHVPMVGLAYFPATAERVAPFVKDDIVKKKKKKNVIR